MGYQPMRKEANKQHGICQLVTSGSRSQAQKETEDKQERNSAHGHWSDTHSVIKTPKALNSLLINKIKEDFFLI